jgi:hypothetical protein
MSTAPNRIRASAPMRTAARTTAVAATQALGSTLGVSPCRPPGRDYQECWAAHPTARVHRRCPRAPGSRSGTCRKPLRTLIRAPRCAMTGPAPRSTGMPLHRRRLRRRSSPVGAASEPSAWPPRGQADDRAAPPRLPAVTARDPMLLCLSRRSSCSLRESVFPGFAEVRTRQGWAARGGGQALIRSRGQQGGEGPGAAGRSDQGQQRVRQPIGEPGCPGKLRTSGAVAELVVDLAGDVPLQAADDLPL